jgi:DNA-binding NarL/FixJ family response regulator
MLVDDHPVVREGIRAVLEAKPDMTVVAEAGNGREAVRLAGKLRPDVVIMDLSMPLLNGVEAIRQIRKQNPEIKVLVLSGYGDREYVRQVAEVGAVGFLLKKDAADILPAAVREASEGQMYRGTLMDGSTAKYFRPTAQRCAQGATGRDVLTSREVEVVQLVAEGVPNKGIAAELGISIKTVDKYRQLIMYKLDVHEVAGLTRYAIAKGMIMTDGMEAMTGGGPMRFQQNPL